MSRQRRIFHPDSHEAQKERFKRETGSAHGQPRGQKRTRAAGSEPKPGSRNSTKIRKLDDQSVLESGDTKAVSHWSDSMGKRKVGKGRGKQGGQAQRNGQKNNNKRSQPAHIQRDHKQTQMSQGETKSTTNRMSTASESNEKPTEGVLTADKTTRRIGKELKGNRSELTEVRCSSHGCSESRRYRQRWTGTAIGWYNGSLGGDFTCVCVCVFRP